VQKHLALTRHLYNPQAILISRKIWDQFSADERAILEQAAAEARGYQRQVSREQDAVELDALAKTMQVTELPPEEMAKMRERAKPVVDKYNGELDPLLIKTLEAEIAKVRGSN
jgi:TRAP-type C4-dicarboxylate transport system substrate-binding protein